MASESKYEWLRVTGKTFLASEDMSEVANLAIEVGESMISLADELETTSPSPSLLLREATKLWSREDAKLNHKGCTTGPLGMEGCPGGIPCPFEGENHEEIHTIRSAIHALEATLRMMTKGKGEGNG